MLYDSIQSPGLNPANTFLLLSKLLDTEFAGADAPAEFVKFVRAPYGRDGLEMDPQQLLKIVTDLKHPREVAPRRDAQIARQMNAMRARVRELVLGEMPAIGAQGGDRKSNSDDQVDNINLKEQTKGGTDPAYILARLKRDRPDLAEQVVSGKLSANAAAIKAGFRKKPKHTCPECGHTW
jgi:hypothetical protein